ncbi:MAG: hypothetical protein VXX85_05910, partial [Candidatus Margulisiibacteriota bacterium]|nr:hypothetical protein [Candidatus Margulisiibacteriota bacterium]
MILSNLLILFFISSIFHLKKLVTGSRYSSIAFSITSLGAIYWWLSYTLNIDVIFHKATVYNVYPSIPLFLFLMLFEKFSEKVKPIRSVILISSTIYWCICLINSIAITGYSTNLVNDSTLMLLCYLFFAIHTVFLLYNSDTFLLPQLTPMVRTEVLVNFSAIGLLALTQQYSGPFLHLFPIIFSILYALVFLPYLIQYSVRAYKVYIQSFTFSVLVFSIGSAYLPHVKSFNDQDFLLFLTMPFVLIFGLKLFNFVTNKIDSFYPFSIINKDEFNKLIADLKVTISITQIKKVIYNNKLFKSPKHKLLMWAFNHSHLSSLTNDTPQLKAELITFMQYREMVNYRELDELITNYSNTPFQNNVMVLMDFMKKHKIVQIMLIQKSNEIVGISAICCYDKRFEVLDFDTIQHKKLAITFAKSIINLNSANQNVNYQIMMEQVNKSISNFNLNHSLDEIIQLSRKTILNIIPETKYYLFLNFDQASGFYKSTNKLNFNIEKLNIKLHINIINDYLKDNVSCKFSLNNTGTPSELQAAMLLINANQAVLLRVDDSDDSSII